VTISTSRPFILYARQRVSVSAGRRKGQGSRAHRERLVLWRITQFIAQLNGHRLELPCIEEALQTTHLLHIGHSLNGQSDSPDNDTDDVACGAECRIRPAKGRVGHGR
jgi:hypothetical protein